MSKEMKYRAVCPLCNKGFDTRNEGFLYWGHLICANCYHEMDRYNKENEIRVKK